MNEIIQYIDAAFKHAHDRRAAQEAPPKTRPTRSRKRRWNASGGW